MKDLIDRGEACLGIEFGSTRIKAVLTDRDGTMLASGSVGWENRWEDHLWIYTEEQIRDGLRQCYKALCDNIARQYQTVLTRVASIGISGMMHGYLALDRQNNILVPFRTWRNNCTQKEAEQLTGLFGFHIPQRWSITHLYQMVLARAPHLQRLDYLTTLSGYVHYLLTGEKVLGICDASGMFPIDPATCDYDSKMTEQFDRILSEHHLNFGLRSVLPKVLRAGEAAGQLTAEGAGLLDPSGALQAGAIFCPPEGDGGTGMVATNSVRTKTGNISAGTSAFAMVVLEKSLSAVYEEIDLIQTPDGKSAAMVHANNCTTEINAWMSLFGETLALFGHEVPTEELYERLFRNSMEGDPDCGGLTAYGFHSGEHLLGLSEGVPMFLHRPDAAFTLSNFVRAQIYTSFAVLKKGLALLADKEQVSLDHIMAHGGIFQTKGVAQQFLSSAIRTPVSVNNAANEGGAWGIAVLAAYRSRAGECSLEDYLDKVVFGGSAALCTVSPDPATAEGFDRFMAAFDRDLKAEYAAVEEKG